MIKKEQTGWDFSTTEAPKALRYLQPGFYNCTITESTYVKPTETKPDGSPKTPYVEIKFESELGVHIEKFYITPKTLDRLQYLHIAWFDKKLEKLFTDADSVGAYFAKVMTMKPIKKGMEIGGKQGSDKKIYSSLGYSGFILPEDMKFEEGPFEVGSNNYNRVVRMLPANASTGTNEIMLPASNEQKQVEDDFGLPF